MPAAGRAVNASRNNDHARVCLARARLSLPSPPLLSPPPRLRYTESDGFVLTEFAPYVSWSGLHNTIPAAAGHHVLEVMEWNMEWN